MATERWDVDVYVVRDDGAERETSHSPAIDEIPCSIADAAESVSWLLHVVFTLAGRLRPYNKYLPWELRTHPLGVPEWSAAALLPELERTLAGDPDAVRRTFAVVDREVRAWDAAHGTTVCGDLVDAWGDELAIFAVT
jgi:hypothetical protein